ncbi:hypothetical protein ACFV2N_03285 [Streptomyces sp. NPDC059680]|uniref:hypothetical protein n=1 Tax=Streptomyces sp. NPDC059680 TaxID=3346904 RepID=UPI00367DC7DB
MPQGHERRGCPALDTGLERAGRPAAQALRGGLDAEATADRVLDAASAVDDHDDVCAGRATRRRAKSRTPSASR